MTEESDKPHGVIFLPYAHMAVPHSIAGVDFVPFRMPDSSVNPSVASGAAAIEKILASYRDRSGAPLLNCIVATIAGRGWDLTESDLVAVQWAASLLFLASWSCNEYFPRFGGNYVNSSSFRPVCQKFTGSEPVYISLHARRRDGGTLMGGYRHGQALFSLPIQCSTRDPIAVDAPLLAALESTIAAGNPTIKRLQTALPFAGLANTDDDLMTDSAEAILMASAFEQLLGSDEHAYELGKRFGTLLAPFGTVTVADAMRERPGISIDTSTPERAAAQPTWWVHRKWMEELHQLRSQAVHEGHSHTGADWGWKMDEHMLMAAHAFPLTVKILLDRDGHYRMTNGDKSRCRAIDRILAVTEWGAESGDGPKWNSILAETARHDRLQQITDEFLSRHPEIFQDRDAANSESDPTSEAHGKPSDSVDSAPNSKRQDES